jgi:membrane-bound lytic murein transglycosylase B
MQPFIKYCLYLLCIALLGCILPALADPLPPPSTQIHTFALKMQAKHHFDATQVETLLNNTTVYDSILTSISKPAEKKPWHQYRPIFLDKSRIQEGVKFWKKYDAALNKAQQRYGVPPEIIIALLGAETRYGKITGNYLVLDALTTLAFYYPPRNKFFQDELEQYLLMTRELKLDPKMFKGSYAGAIGAPQFMPSNYRLYAVDFAGNGKVDLMHNMVDVIGSVANYVKQHGWQANGIVAVPATITGNRYQTLNTDDIRLQLTLGDLAEYGVKPQYAPLADHLPARLIVLGTSTGLDYWLGLNNFYVLTLYNRSTNYAMAVYELAQAIRADYMAQTIAPLSPQHHTFGTRPI